MLIPINYYREIIKESIKIINIFLAVPKKK